MSETFLDKIKRIIKKKLPIFYLVLFNFLCMSGQVIASTYWEWKNDLVKVIYWGLGAIGSLIFLIFLFLLWYLEKNFLKFKK